MWKAALAILLALLTACNVQEQEMSISLKSPAFENNGYIPDRYTCKGMDISPPLILHDIPAGTKTMALIVEDPDAPMGTWVHWIAWNIPVISEIKEGKLPDGSMEGLNDFERTKYGGPCPPSGVHHYLFKLYALDITLDLGQNSRKSDVEDIIQDHVIEKAELIGLYKR